MNKELSKTLKQYDFIMELAWEAALQIDNGGEWPECPFTDEIDIKVYNKEIKRLLNTGQK